MPRAFCPIPSARKSGRRARRDLFPGQLLDVGRMGKRTIKPFLDEGMEVHEEFRNSVYQHSVEMVDARLPAGTAS